MAIQLQVYCKFWRKRALNSLNDNFFVDRVASDDMEIIAIIQILYNLVGNLFQMKIKTVLHVLVKNHKKSKFCQLNPSLLKRV